MVREPPDPSGGTPLRVAQLWRHPVKSMQGEPLEVADVVQDGFRGDRAWGIRDHATGKILTGRREPRLLLASACLSDYDTPHLTLPDGTNLVGLGAAVDRRLTAWLGYRVELVAARHDEPAHAEMFADATDDTSETVEWQMPTGRFVDAFPILVLTTASLRAGAAAYPAGTWDPRRFRPNILIDAAGNHWVEDSWQGASVQIGREVRVAVARPAARCTMITRPQPGLARDLDIYRTVARVHGGNLGMWAKVETGGSLRVSDTASLR